jgi:hypothetical protein
MSTTRVIGLGLWALSAAVGGCAVSGKAVIEQYQNVTPTRFEGAVAVVLEDRSTGVVDERGEGVVVDGFKRVKLLDRKGLDCGPDAKNCRVMRWVCYNETWDKVELLEARTITPEGEVIPVPRDEMTDRTFTTWAIPDQDQRCFVWMMKGASPGAIFEEKWRIRSSKILGVGGMWFQDQDPILEASITVDAPVDYAYRWKVYNADIQPTEERVGNRIRRTWTAREMAPIVYEEGMIAPDDVVAKLVLANENIAAFGDYPTCRKIRTWEDMGNCWQEMIAKQQEITEPLKEIVKKIEATARTETEKLKAVWDYMNTHIRYVGLERGLEGFIPLSAHTVCDKKYGDCKAVAGMISVLCRALGLKSDPILLGVRPAVGMLELDLPGPFYFNHSIARVEADGQVYWMDATYRTFDFATTPAANQGVKVIVSRPGAPFVDEIPVQPAETNRRELKAVFAPSPEGHVGLEVEMTGTGNVAGRYRAYAYDLTDDRWKKAMERFLADSYPRARLEAESKSGKEDNNLPFGIQLKAVVENAMQSTGAGLSFEVRDPFGISLAQDFSLPRRRYALDLGYLTDFVSRYEVQVPAGLQPAGLPRNVSHEDEFLRFERLSQIENDRLVAEYRLTMKMLIIPAEKYPVAREAYLKALDASKFAVVLEPVKQKGARVGAAR